jgi:hypothetical protein
MPVIPVLEKQKKKDHNFEFRVGYIARFCHKKKINEK